MKTSGIITNINGKKIQVTVYRESACASCNKCIESDKNIGTFEIYSDDIYSINEQVIVELGSSFVLRNSFLIYLLPVVLFFLFYFIGDIIFKNSDLPIYFSFFGIGFSFLILRYIDKKRSENINVVIYKL